MADRKISDLTALTAPAAGDYLPIVDISEASAANKNKRITIEELLRGAPDGTAAAPSIGFESDPNTGIYRPGADQLAISTGGTGRLFVDASGRVGVGTGSPGSIFDVKPSASASTIRYEVGTLNSDSIRISAGGTVNTYLEYRGYLGHAWFVDATERARIDSSGRLLVGTSSARSNLFTGSNTSTTLVEAAGSYVASAAHVFNANSVAGPELVFGKTRGTTVGSNTIVQSGDDIGGVWFTGADGTNFIAGAAIQAKVDGTPGANDMPGRLVFSTTADGASSPTERMRISSNGSLTVTGVAGSTHTLATNSAERVRWNDNGTYLTTLPTTAAAANAHIWTSSSPANLLMLSTSSIRYKTEVEDLSHEKSDALLNFRPVWYRSLCELDNKDWSWYGLIAEEVAEIEPRLVHWTYLDESYEQVENEDGSTAKQLKSDAELVPNGVQYDRLTVLLLDLVQRQNKRIETLEAKVAALEAS